MPNGLSLAHILAGGNLPPPVYDVWGGCAKAAVLHAAIEASLAAYRRHARALAHLLRKLSGRPGRDQGKESRSP
jgi:hypothetical protein